MDFTFFWGRTCDVLFVPTRRFLRLHRTFEDSKGRRAVFFRSRTLNPKDFAEISDPGTPFPLYPSDLLSFSPYLGFR